MAARHGRRRLLFGGGGLLLAALLGPLAAPAAATIQADFSCSPSCTVAEGTTVTFTSTSTSSTEIEDYQWDLDGDALFGAGDDPDEPNGRDASTAQRSFPTAGEYTIGLRVTNRERQTGTVNKTVTVAGPEPPPDGLRFVPANLHTDRLRGPRSLGPGLLGRLARQRDPRSGLGEDQEYDPAFDFPGPPVGCLQVFCGIEIETDQALLTPPVVGKAFDTGGGIDPQIAASRGYLVIGKRDTVWFYDKSGKPLLVPSPGHTQLQIPYEIPLCSLFKPLIPNINAALDAALPNHLKDIDGNAITVQNGYGINCDKVTGGVKPAEWTLEADDCDEYAFYWPKKMFFDARVLWDEYQKRFWIIALLLNGQTKQRYACGCPDNCPAAEPGTLNAGRAHHGLLAFAVSKTQDPRDGWNEYWTWGYPGQDSCPNNECPYIGGVDYLSAGITSKHLLLEYTALDGQRKGDFVADRAHLVEEGFRAGERRRQIMVLPTDPAVAPGGKAPPVYSNTEPLVNYTGSPRRGRLEPAVQHGPDFDGGAEAFFVSPEPGGAVTKELIVLWLMSFGSNEPTCCFQLPVHVNPYRGIGGEPAPQLGSSIPANIAVDGINKLVYRNGSLYTTFGECASWAADGVCTQAGVRFIRLGINGIVKSAQAPGGVTQLFVDKQVDVSFGESGSWYAFPGLEVNKNGDAAFVYQRSGRFTSNPEVRYSVHFKGESDPRPSGLLMAAKGARICSGHQDNCWPHYLGLSVDPFDQTGIWMIHAFGGKSGGWRHAAGKVLGKPQPDLAFEQAAFKALGQASAGGLRYRLTLVLRNLGDGSARKSKAAIFLTRGRGAGISRAGTRKPVLLKRVRIRRLGSGRTREIRLRVRVPARRRPYRFLAVKLDAGRRLREYGEGNNTAYLRLAKRPRRP